MELSLPFGPWREIASADWNGVPLGVYSNVSKEMLVVAFPPDGPEAESQGIDPTTKKGDKKVLVLLFGPMLLEGNSTKFLENQKRDLTFFEKTIDKKTFKYLLLQAQPYFGDYKQDELAKAVRGQREELEALQKVTSEIAKNYSCTATALSKTDEIAAENFFGDPIILFSLGASRQSKISYGSLQEKSFILGFARQTNDAVEIQLGDLVGSASAIIGQSEKERVSAMQLVCEGMVSNGIQCIVLGEKGLLQKMAFPNPNADSLKKFDLSKPTGFPVKTAELGKSFLIDLRFVSPQSFCKAFCNESFAQELEKNWGESSLAELAEKMDSGREKHSAGRAARLLNVIGRKFKNSFGRNDLPELKNPWGEKAGKVVLVHVPHRELYEIALESLVKGFKTPDESANSVGLVLEENACSLSGASKQILQTAPPQLLKVLNGDSESCFEGISPSLKIELLGGDAVLENAGEKKRLQLRPTFSQPAL